MNSSRSHRLKNKTAERDPLDQEDLTTLNTENIFNIKFDYDRI